MLKILYYNLLLYTKSMQNNNQVDSKRSSFRLQIRRKQIDSILAQSRNKFKQHNSASISNYFGEDPANLIIMKKSLVKNCLLNQFPNILQSLHHKLKLNFSLPNIQFVISVTCNILRDEISLHQKQYAYQFCFQALQSVNPFNISPLVEVYFYETVMAVCYESLQERKQAQIEKHVFTRLFLLLRGDYQLDRVPSEYSKVQCQQQIEQGVISCLNYFYTPEVDHNIILLYKVKRTSARIRELIDWSNQKIKRMAQDKQNKKRMLTFQYLNEIWNRISSISESITYICGPEYIKILINMLRAQINQGMSEENIKILTLQTLTNIVQDQQTNSFLIMTGPFLKTLSSELQNSVNSRYSLGVIKLLRWLLYSANMTKIQQIGQISTVLLYFLSLVTNIISIQQEDTEHYLLLESLYLIRNIASIGYDLGRSQFIQHLSSIGGQQMIDGLYIKQKNKEILEVIESIYIFFDLC